MSQTKPLVKIAFVGGYPKGEGLPAFSIVTLSGQRLRKMVREIGGIDARYVDLWETAEEEKEGKIDPETKSYLVGLIYDGYQIIALGKYVNQKMSGVVPHLHWPHPAARNPKCVKQLKMDIEHYVRLRQRLDILDTQYRRNL